RPAGQRVVAIRFALPRILLVCPVVGLAGVLFIEAVPPGPAAPIGMLGVAEAGGNEIDERRAIPLFLLVRRVGRVHLAERAVAGADVALNVEAARGGRKFGKPVIPPLAVHFRAE